MSDTAIPAGTATSAQLGQLRRIARFQRWVLVGLLIDIGLVLFVAFGVQKSLSEIAESLHPLLQLCFLVFFLFKVAGIVMLGRELTSWPLAVVFGVLSFFPPLSILILVSLNTAATKYLKKRGVSVGLLGANPRRIAKTSGN
jgi:hypothetical protein